MSKLISPLTGAASGFPEYTPAQQRAFELAVSRVKMVYESFGFTPLETAAVEKLSTLESKGIAAKEVYGLRRLAAGEGEDGGKDLALRFDLTVPTARYVVENQGALVFPFRRYQVQPVWRGERAQAGRYRQFYQFDIDTIGDGTLPLAADTEVIAAGVLALRALGVERFTVKINNRKLLMGMIQQAEFRDIPATLKALDDMDKVGHEATLTKLCTLTEPSRAEQFFARIKHPHHTVMSNPHLNELSREGLREIEAMFAPLEAMLGRELAHQIIRFDFTRVVNPDFTIATGLTETIKRDMTITRGLDYYTGTVVETTLDDAPELGSIMSGGRYEDLAAHLGKKKLPGVGISIGLSRLMNYLLTLPQYQLSATPADVLVAGSDESFLPIMASVAQQLRAMGVKVELAFPAGKGIGQQLQTAEKRGLKCAITGFEGEKIKLRIFADRLDLALEPNQLLDAIKSVNK